MSRLTRHPLVFDARSVTPRQDLGGLSPSQARALLADPIDDTGPLRIAADVASSCFDAVPTLGLDNARRVLWLLEAEGPWRLNTRGDLPRSVAISLLRTLEWWPGYVTSVDESDQSLTGDDLSGVSGTRRGLQAAGLIQLAGGELSVTQDGKRMLDKSRTGELASRILRAMLRDEGYEDERPDQVFDPNRGVRRRRKLLLWKLSTIHDGWWPVDDLVRELTTREVRVETEDYEEFADDRLDTIMSGLLLAPLADLGLLEFDLDGYSRSTSRYRRTPLFEQMLHWRSPI